MNTGQLALLLRAAYLVDVQSISQVRGLPFTTVELVQAITTAVEAGQSTMSTQGATR